MALEGYGRDALPRDPGVHVSKAFFRVLPSGFGASGELVFTFLRRTYPDRAGARPLLTGACPYRPKISPKNTFIWFQDRAAASAL